MQGVRRTKRKFPSLAFCFRGRYFFLNSELTSLFLDLVNKSSHTGDHSQFCHQQYKSNKLPAMEAATPSLNVVSKIQAYISLTT